MYGGSRNAILSLKQMPQDAQMKPSEEMQLLPQNHKYKAGISISIITCPVYFSSYSTSFRACFQDVRYILKMVHSKNGDTL